MYTRRLFGIVHETLASLLGREGLGAVGVEE